jgi:SAM-dependent methyltransferase
MPGDCCTARYDAQFDDETARRDLLEYRANGPDGSTRRLIDALRDAGVRDATLLDIGGGIGAVQLELLGAGVRSATDVDASEAYLATARREAEERGLGERIRYLHGDFVELADEVDPADIVTLDRVICCYPHVVPLVERSAGRAQRLYGLVYPRDRWWVRLGMRLGNLGCIIFRNDFRIYVHPQRTIDRILAAAGWRQRYAHAGWIWQTAVWERA